MKVIFNSIEFDNFMSYEHAHIDFDQTGITMISGENNFKHDATSNNGAGKSTMTDAISWAITGDTIRGAKNVNRVDMKSFELYDCCVKLNFSIDDNEYEIIRTKTAENKQGLQIFMNGEEESGQGIKATEEILKDLLPDLTAELLGSVIILGQGMPSKLTDFKPSGRKELLEKLSKLNAANDDLKNRVARRKLEIDNLTQQNNSDKSASTAKIESYKQSIEQNQKDLDNLPDKTDLLNKKTTYEQFNVDKNSEIEKLTKTHEEKVKIRDDFRNQYREVKGKSDSLEDDKDAKKAKIESSFTSKSSKLTEDYSKNVEKKAEFEKQLIGEENNSKTKLNEGLTKIDTQNRVDINELNEQILNNNNDIKNAKAEIKKIDDIKEICPYCGQKITSVHKPSKEPYEKIIAEKERENSELNARILTFNEKAIEDKRNITDKIKAEFSAIKEKISASISLIENEEKRIDEEKQKLENEKQVDLNKLDVEYEEKEKELNKKISDIKDQGVQVAKEVENLEDQINTLKKEIESNENILKNIEKSITEIDSNKQIYTNNIQRYKNMLEEENRVLVNLTAKEDELALRAKAIKTCETVISREFRGILLDDTIDYVNSRCEYYSSKLFDGAVVSFKRDKNDIDIMYLNKMYENLSGGEKRKVDLIVQFSLRDMLKTLTNFSCNILFADEIFDGLDALSTDKVINLISTEFNDISSLYVISHHTDIGLSYDNIIKVIKDEGGISHVNE